MNARLETRLLAMGVAESVYRMTGSLPKQRNPWPTIGGYAIFIVILCGSIALAAI